MKKTKENLDKRFGWFDRKGNYLGDLTENAEKIEKLLRDFDYKIIKQEKVGNFFVSTVWLGLNHAFNDGPPLIFETMVWDESKKKYHQPNKYFSKGYTDRGEELEQIRYSTEEQAIQGHQKMVEKYAKR